MKTTLELPNEVFRKVKATAALRGMHMKEFITEALEEKLFALSTRGDTSPPWMRGFGALADLRDETRRIEERIAETFEQTDEEDRA